MMKAMTFTSMTFAHQRINQIFPSLQEWLGTFQSDSALGERDPQIADERRTIILTAPPMYVRWQTDQ